MKIADLEPVILVERCASIEQDMKAAVGMDLLIIDAPPNSNAATLRMARDRRG